MAWSSGRARSFGSVAASYEKFRTGYPPELVDVVLAYAGRPIRAALEIGAGTGKATRVFAQRGIAVTATEPDGAMLAELRKHVPASVVPEQAAFEDLRLGQRFDLVYAAASLHWTEPDGRWARLAAMLVPGGVLASFGGPVHLADADLAETVRAARAEILPDDDVPSPDGTSPFAHMQWPGTELLRSDEFEDVRQSMLEQRVMMSAEDYVGLLSTISAYLHLRPDKRAQVFDRILQVLPARVEVNADVTVHLARRVG